MCNCTIYTSQHFTQRDGLLPLCTPQKPMTFVFSTKVCLMPKVLKLWEITEKENIVERERLCGTGLIGATHWSLRMSPSWLG